MSIKRVARWVGWAAAVVWLGAAALALAGCRPGAAAVGQGIDYTAYIAEDFLAKTFVPLDGATLADAAGVRPEIGLASAGGATAVEVEHTAGRANIDPETAWIVVTNPPGGAERTRFHPPVSGLAVGLSADGARLLWEPFPPPSTYPPPVEWYVLDVADGSVIAHIRDEDNACFRQSALFAPDGGRLYCLVDPALNEISGSQPVRVVAYEVNGHADPAAPAGNPAAGVALETRIGQRPAADGTGRQLLEPALALSPDGGTLAVVHADTDAITLIDAAGLTVERTFTLRPAATLWDWLGLAAAPAHAKGEMQGIIRQAVFSADGRFLYVFSQELRAAGEAPPAEWGLWLVDLERELVLVKALPEYQIQWVLPAPDGSVYAFGTTDENPHPYEIRESSPSRLWRLDGATLEVLAEREFAGYRAGRIILRSP
jgi:hypothetical protein